MTSSSLRVGQFNEIESSTSADLTVVVASHDSNIRARSHVVHRRRPIGAQMDLESLDSQGDNSREATTAAACDTPSLARLLRGVMHGARDAATVKPLREIYGILAVASHSGTTAGRAAADR